MPCFTKAKLKNSLLFKRNSGRRLAARGFVTFDNATAAVSACEAGGFQWDAALLGPLCPLIGRKFNAATTVTVLQLLSTVRVDSKVGLWRRIWKCNP
jgi:hypothetical protein